MIEKININDVERSLPNRPPFTIRGLDASGNSIISTLTEVARALPKRNNYSIALEPEETYLLLSHSYNSAFIYEIKTIGDGCMVLFCWRNPIIFGSNYFIDSDTPGKVCIYNHKVGETTIKNRTTSSIQLSINII